MFWKNVAGTRADVSNFRLIFQHLQVQNIWCVSNPFSLFFCKETTFQLPPTIHSYFLNQPRIHCLVLNIHYLNTLCALRETNKVKKTKKNHLLSAIVLASSIASSNWMFSWFEDKTCLNNYCWNNQLLNKPLICSSKQFMQCVQIRYQKST